MCVVEGLIFFKGVNDTLDRFTDQLVSGAEKRGIATLVIDANGNMIEAAGEIERFHCEKGRKTAAILFNNVYLSIYYDDVSIWDLLQIPVFNILVDHPVNYQKTLSDRIENMHAVLIDRKHEAFVREVFPWVRWTHFLPLGGQEQPGWKPYAQRKIDLLFTGAFCDERPYARIPFFEDDGRAFYRELMYTLISTPGSVTEEVVRQYVSQAGCVLSEQELLELYGYAVTICEFNARSHYQKEIMKQLNEAQIPVTIYGQRWQQTGIAFSDRFHITERVPIEECVKLPGDAKIALNIMPWFKEGAHDRIFDAMLNGAVCVTDTSGYLLERFSHGRELVFFQLDDLSMLVENVRWLLDNPVQAEELAWRGYMTALQNDTWEKRLDTLLGFIRETDAE